MRLSLELFWAGKESGKAIKDTARANARRKILATCSPFIFSEIKKKSSTKTNHIINNSIVTTVFCFF